MAEWHLNDLENALGRTGWRVKAELPGNDYNISVTWEIVRGPSEKRFIDFSGLDDMETLPIEQSYGCSVRERQECDLYFGRMGEKNSEQRNEWQLALSKFVSALGQAKDD